MSVLAEWAHAFLSPSPLQLAIAVVLIFTIPIFLHAYLVRTSGLTSLPSILLVGPSGSGKTTFLTRFERGENAPTHTSQTPLTVECSLPLGTTAGSDKYRSVNDPTHEIHKKFLIIDTPGHGKLHHYALKNITEPQNLKGIIFLVDSASLSAGDEGLRQSAEYLHDTLLLLQKRATKTTTSKAPKQMPLLIAANKMDLFAAIPAAMVKNVLEKEITKVRKSKSRALLDSGIGMGEAAEDNDDWLGAMGSTDFKFEQLAEFDISVEIAGGSALGSGNVATEKWWSWIADRL